MMKYKLQNFQTKYLWGRVTICLFFIFFALILVKCEREVKTINLELFCVDQLNNAVMDAEVIVSDFGSRFSNYDGRCIFKIPENRLTSSFHIRANSADCEYVNPESLSLIGGKPTKYLINFLRKYEFNFHTSRINNEEDTLNYMGVDIFYGDSLRGTTNDSGKLLYTSLQEKDGAIEFQAKGPSNKKVKETIEFNPDEFQYDINFYFRDRPQIKPRRNKTITVTVFSQEGENQIPQPNVSISKKWKRLGATDSNGKFELTIDKSWYGATLKALQITPKGLRRATTTIKKNKSNYKIVFTEKSLIEEK